MSRWVGGETVMRIARGDATVWYIPNRAHWYTVGQYTKELQYYVLAPSDRWHTTEDFSGPHESLEDAQIIAEMLTHMEAT